MDDNYQNDNMYKGKVQPTIYKTCMKSIQEKYTCC